jgi:hypothetical protein
MIACSQNDIRDACCANPWNHMECGTASIGNTSGDD